MKVMNLESVIFQSHEDRHSLAQVTDMCPICHDKDNTSGDAVIFECYKREFHLDFLF